MYSTFMNLNLSIQLTIIFFIGVALGVLLMIFVLNVKNKKINAYQRRLEKESVSSDENEAKVKILEAKNNLRSLYF